MIGAINANHTLLAKRAGYKAIYLSGGGVAAGSLDVPDLNINGLEDVLIDIRRITYVCYLPLIVDVDTGFGSSAFNIARTVKSVIKAGTSALHIVGQVGAKRWGYRSNKELVGKEEIVDRIKAVVDAATDPDSAITARTDSLAAEDLDAAIDRARAFMEAGADALFPEAIRDLETYKEFTDAYDVPILDNMTEFGMTPLFTVDELAGVEGGIVIYPLSAFRAMNKAAEAVYEDIS
jgi:methylisocitrate lyase